MKSYRYFLLLVIILFAGCEDDVLELQPFDAISEEAAFTTPDRIELSMNGVYDAAQSGFYRADENNNRGYIFGAAHIQQGDMRGEDMLLINTFYGFTYQATYTPVTENNRYFWENGFRVVNLVNLFIEGVTGAVEGEIISADEGNSYIAEARFLRGLTYHEMLIHFARPYRDGNGSEPGLPLHTVGNNSSGSVEENSSIERSTVAQTYTFILEDLDYAEANLPESRSGVLNVTRATRGAAIALKTRVKLHQGDWDGVVTEGNKLVPGSAPFISPINDHALTTSVEGPWANNQSEENIFSMNMSANDNLNVNAALANMYGSSSLGARGEVAISPIIWNESFWHPDDLRRTLLVESGASDRLFTSKYRDYVNNSDFSPILRYAEVILNLAEAEARNGNTTRGSELLNAVRDRAISGTMTSYGTIADANILAGRILEERRIEYLAEGQRWKDIHRNAVDPLFSTDGIPAKMFSADVDGSTYSVGDAGSLVKGIGAISYDNFRFLWPIPASETTVNPVLAAQQTWLLNFKNQRK